MQRAYITCSCYSVPAFADLLGCGITDPQQTGSGPRPLPGKGSPKGSLGQAGRPPASGKGTKRTSPPEAPATGPAAAANGAAPGAKRPRVEPAATADGGRDAAKRTSRAPTPPQSRSASPADGDHPPQRTSEASSAADRLASAIRQQTENFNSASGEGVAKQLQACRHRRLQCSLPVRSCPRLQLCTQRTAAILFCCVSASDTDLSVAFAGGSELGRGAAMVLHRSISGHNLRALLTPLL